jgi:hypothetical protein
MLSLKAFSEEIDISRRIGRPGTLEGTREYDVEVASFARRLLSLFERYPRNVLQPSFNRRKGVA